MRTSGTSNTAIVVLVVAALLGGAAFVVGGLGTRTDELTGEEFDPAAITDVPLVVAKHESGGFELLGLQLDAPDRWLSFAVKPPAACLRLDDGGEVVLGGAGCDAFTPVAGPVRGGGVTIDGDRWVELWVEVDVDCHRAADVGDEWPALPESCR